MVSEWSGWETAVRLLLGLRIGRRLARESEPLGKYAAPEMTGPTGGLGAVATK